MLHQRINILIFCLFAAHDAAIADSSRRLLIRFVFYRLGWLLSDELQNKGFVNPASATAHKRQRQKPADHKCSWLDKLWERAENNASLCRVGSEGGGCCFCSKCIAGYKTGSGDLDPHVFKTNLVLVLLYIFNIKLWVWNMQRLLSRGSHIFIFNGTYSQTFCQHDLHHPYYFSVAVKDVFFSISSLSWHAASLNIKLWGVYNHLYAAPFFKCTYLTVTLMP